MSRLARRFKASLEAQNPVEVISDSELNTLALEAFSDVRDIDDGFEAIDSAMEDIDNLSSIRIIYAKEEYSPISLEQSQITAIAVDRIYQRLGITKANPVPSLESSDSQASRQASMQIAMEGVGEVVGKVWDSIKAVFKKIWEMIKSFFKKVKAFFTGLFSRNKKLDEKIKEAKKTNPHLIDTPITVTEDTVVSAFSPITSHAELDDYMGYGKNEVSEGKAADIISEFHKVVIVGYIPGNKVTTVDTKRLTTVFNDTIAFIEDCEKRFTNYEKVVKEVCDFINGASHIKEIRADEGKAKINKFGDDMVALADIEKTGNYPRGLQFVTVARIETDELYLNVTESDPSDPVKVILDGDKGEPWRPLADEHDPLAKAIKMLDNVEKQIDVIMKNYEGAVDGIKKKTSAKLPNEKQFVKHIQTKLRQLNRISQYVQKSITISYSMGKEFNEARYGYLQLSLAGLAKQLQMARDKEKKLKTV